MDKREDVKAVGDLYGMLEAIVTRTFIDEEIMECFKQLSEYGEELCTHCLNVAIYSWGIGRYFNKDDIFLQDLFKSALLHDFGKVFIPHPILEKRGQFTWDERKLVEFHPYMGYAFLKKNYSFNEDILLGILDHHEKADGSGYGRQKKLSEISGYGKIIAVSDVYDAMITDRPYRPGVDPETAMQYIQNKTGKFFDPVITDVFSKCLSLQNDEFEYIKEFTYNKAIRYKTRSA